MTTSFSDLLSSPTDHNLRGSERPQELSDQTASGVPKFKSTPPPSLPISHPQTHPLPPISPSYFNIPHGLSLAELLDSPVLLHSSNVSQLFFSFLSISFIKGYHKLMENNIFFSESSVDYF